MIRVGGGFQRLEDYLLKNEFTFQQTLDSYVKVSGQNIEWVIKELMKGKKIRHGGPTIAEKVYQR
jgi:hypothetical protein